MIRAKCKNRDEFIDEAKHESSSRVVKMFYDFYAIDYVYHYIVNGNKIINRCKYDKIVSTRENIVLEFAKMIEKELEYSVRREAAYCFPSDLFTPQEYYDDEKNRYKIWWGSEAIDASVYVNFMTCYSLTNKDMCKKKMTYEHVDLSLLVSAFAFDEKNTSYDCDMWESCYGGELWANATRLLIELKKLLKLNNVYDKLALTIDAILDLQHNNGFIMNKTGFGVLSGTKLCEWDGYKDDIEFNHLDNRYNLKSIDDYKPYCSTKVRNLITATGRHIPH